MRVQIDGGYLNNMPVDVMRELGVDTVRQALPTTCRPCSETLLVLHVC